MSGSAAPNHVGSVTAVQCTSTDVAVIGGGVVGVLTAQRLRDRGIAFRVIERLQDFGGCWITEANNYSTLQAPEIGYRLHHGYPLGTKGHFEQIKGTAMLTRLREMAKDLGIDQHVDFNCEVDTIRLEGNGYLLVISDVRTGEKRHLRAEHIMVCHGMLGRQYMPEERGLTVSKGFKGILTAGGRLNGTDCALNTKDITGKSVVVMGKGAFACEAMRCAVWNGAASTTMLTRGRARWIVPYSRQYCYTALSLTPLVPWAWKMTLLKAWLARRYYKPCGLEHLIPSGAAKDMDLNGQAHDEYFDFARNKDVKHVVGRAKAVEERGVVLEDGSVLPADVVVFCGGCEYQASPPFLAELGLGFEDLHSFAFLGDGGRIGTASDGIFAYVPVGPSRQIDMFLHAYDLHKAGRTAELQAALERTPIPPSDLVAKGHRTVWGTWFETSGKYATLSRPMEMRNAAYWKVMSAGRSPWDKARFAVSLAYNGIFLWAFCCILAVQEKLHKWRVYH